MHIYHIPILNFVVNILITFIRSSEKIVTTIAIGSKCKFTTKCHGTLCANINTRFALHWSLYSLPHSHMNAPIKYSWLSINITNYSPGDVCRFIARMGCLIKICNQEGFKGGRKNILSKIFDSKLDLPILIYCLDKNFCQRWYIEIGHAAL